ncbi:MAG: type IV pilin N-terminal domain-containing protein [Methanocellales archaeon]|nr:type IV pilin N-terminal domain-containing protein [Methanocellales archaeon]
MKRMKDFAKGFRGDEGVSPVIGEILMVAVVVILAAVMAAYLFGMAPMNVAPQASIRGSVEQIHNYNCIKLEHQGGEEITLTGASIRVIVNGTVIETLPGGKLTAGESCYIWIEGGKYHLSEDKAAANPDYPLPENGKTATVKIVDIASEQLIADIRVRG